MDSTSQPLFFILFIYFLHKELKRDSGDFVAKDRAPPDTRRIRISYRSRSFNFTNIYKVLINAKLMGT